MNKTGNPPNVLIVEDEEDLADLYSAYLEKEYQVTTVHSGEQAIEVLDTDHDVILLDRRMPGLSGDELLNIIKEDGDDYRVAMVTAVDPDFDVLEMGIDEYLVKPIEKDDLHKTVERLLDKRNLEDKRLELSSKRVRLNVLEVEKSQAELAESEAYQNLKMEIHRLEEELNPTAGDRGNQESPPNIHSRN